MKVMFYYFVEASIDPPSKPLVLWLNGGFFSFSLSHSHPFFPSSGDVVYDDVGPFRTSVRAFLTKHATLPPPSSLFPHLLTWQILFRVGDLADETSPAVVCLDVVEKDVARSRSVYCDQCRVVGWSGNPVCAQRYHFIIQSDGSSIGGYQKSCAGCGDVLLLSESRCKSCHSRSTSCHSRSTMTTTPLFTPIMMKTI